MNPLSFPVSVCPEQRNRDPSILPPARIQKAFYRRSQSMPVPGKVQMVQDIMFERFSLRSESLIPPMAFQRAFSDPSRAVIPEKLVPPPYTQEDSVQCDFQEDIHAKALMQQFFFSYKTDPFVSKITEKTKTELFTFKRENITYPQIACPLKKALEIHIQYYQQKYNICIHLATLKTLSQLVHRLQESLAKPSYVGVVLAQTDAELEDGHVLPLLCSFGRARNEFLLMDVVGPESELAQNAFSLLLPYAASENICIAWGERQADTTSCRTGALSLLRNAHLSLRFHHVEEGLRDPLQGLCGCAIDCRNAQLPSEWTYGEQIFRGNKEAIAIRDLFSKKMEKARHPRTVGVFRQQHTEPVHFRCAFYNFIDSRADFTGLVPPESVQAEISDTETRIVFSKVIPINTYLLHKGFQRACLEKKTY